MFCLSTIFFSNLAKLVCIDSIDFEGEDLFSTLLSLLEIVYFEFYCLVFDDIHFCYSLLRLREKAVYFSCMFLCRLSTILLTASILIIVPIYLFTLCLNYVHSFLSSLFILRIELSTIFSISSSSFFLGLSTSFCLTCWGDFLSFSLYFSLYLYRIVLTYSLVR